MRKETVIVSISKKTGEILRAESHGVKGKACLDLLEQMFVKIIDVSEVELTSEYHESDDSKVSRQDHVDITEGDGQ